MNETANILRNASNRSLVIMDEVGRGTGTADGLAIARAVCEYLLGGDGVLLAAEKLNIDVKQVLMVGDYIFDIQAGIDAGAATVYLSNTSESVTPEVESDYTISNLKELKDIIHLLYFLMPFVSPVPTQLVLYAAGLVLLFHRSSRQWFDGGKAD